MKKYPITWTQIKGLPGCYDHDHRDILPDGHTVMIQEKTKGIWRVIYTYPFTEFLARHELEVASEGRVSISYSAELNQITVIHQLGSFNRCRIAGRFYIEQFLEAYEEDMESTNKGPEEKSSSSPL